MSEKNMLVAQETQVTEQQKNITDSVLNKVQALEKAKTITMPQGYNPGNALKAAWLKLQSVVSRDKKPALEVCSKASIANALFDMCIQGLSPAKNQCYFIVRGQELTMMRSYFGTLAVLKRLNGVSDVFAQVVYKGDAFEYVIDGGNIIVTKHEQKLENIDMNNIVGAYCVIVKDGKPRCEIMTIDQIKKSWSHTTNGGSVQNEYPDQMAKRTVINRGAKMYVNASDDADELIEAINHTTENEYVETTVENGDPVALPEPEVVEAESKPIEVAEKATNAKRGKPGF